MYHPSNVFSDCLLSTSMGQAGCWWYGGKTASEQGEETDPEAGSYKPAWRREPLRHLKGLRYRKQWMSQGERLVWETWGVRNSRGHWGQPQGSQFARVESANLGMVGKEAGQRGHPGALPEPLTLIRRLCELLIGYIFSFKIEDSVQKTEWKGRPEARVGVSNYTAAIGWGLVRGFVSRCS